MSFSPTLQTPAAPKPAPAVLNFTKHTNKRWPPMADRSALPYKLTVISKEKLAREATAPDPNLRRCVAHFRLHCGSVLWTENDMKSRISSFDFEETDEEDNEEDEDDLPEIQIPPRGRNGFVRVEMTESPLDTKVLDTYSAPSPPDHGLFSNDGHCVETVSKNNLCCFAVSAMAA
ncbi:hypothetical protein POX_d05585 [Penicillium oxalicum]|uniref:Uncharacterized protein n=1 Tax=Penicillium oxalicum (strain 114-2 / CGMCC 5302) TaxID=933388 RepID=S7ZU08_PENO1|nr:hypothetical protein POX_d05585 [Penicillium oxalicum]EPS32251.1 hypothetical protein PDE_07211 [Penicillium oxalicum 114-2]KAI2790081.1 hypothetical protein POX_d05585 [Penicillium oxalicum]